MSFNYYSWKYLLGSTLISLTLFANINWIKKDLSIIGPTPTAILFAIQPSCDQNAIQSNGYLQLSAFTNADRINWIAGSDYVIAGGDIDYANATPIGALPFQFNTGIANPVDTQNYTIRVFNGASDCFADYVVTMTEQDCTLSCNCTENIYLNETTTGGSVHKFEINVDGSLSEIGAPWFDNTASGEQLISPHGLATDLNGFLYIGETYLDGHQIRRFTCDGEIIPDSTFGITTNGQFNIGSIGNTLYVAERKYNGIIAYDLCTGLEVSRLDFCEGNGNNGNWGFYIDPSTKLMYATQSQVNWRQKRVYIFSEADFTPTGTPCVSQIDTFRNDPNFLLGHGRLLGVTTDTAENIYLVVYTDETMAGNPTYILKYGPGPAYDFIAKSPIDTLNDGMGFREAHGIVYSETSDRIYVSTNSPVDDCVSIFDTDLNYLGVAVPAPGDSSQAKGIAILKECCPVNNNTTIDTTLCEVPINTTYYLQEFISCIGIICEGQWTEGLGNTGITYNDCNNSITIAAQHACGTFTLTSDGIGNNPQCGAFKITVNIETGTIVAPIIAGDQTICLGEDPVAFTVSTPATGSNTITYQWQSSTTDCLTGFTDIVGATSSIYDPTSSIMDTTYYRVISTIGGGCSSGICADTSNCLTITTTNCDWGDLPDTSATTSIGNYQTTLANNGPVHVVISGLRLGTMIDSELNGAPNSLAQGDNIDNLNDEDGVTIFASLNSRPTGTIRLPLSVLNTTNDTAYLEAWIDWNGDGDFEDDGEMVVDFKDAKDGIFPPYLEIPIPALAITDTSIGFRVRLSNTDNMTPYGKINTGEVEDYLLTITCPSNICLPIKVPD